MSDLHLLDTNYPPGWDVKYDSKTGKCYYINYLTRAMQLEDPRIRYRQLQNEPSVESIPLHTSQTMHASPYHVYPTNHPPAFQAFQGPNTSSMHSISASPLLASKLQQQMEMSNIYRMGSPSISRIIHQFDRSSSIHNNNYQETSFMTPADTDVAVAKINTMFPTASDAHIRLLLKKYHNREAVVISALQVEKHPLTTPGPYSTPPPPRHMLSKKHSLITMTPPLSRFDATSRTASPIPPRPGSCASGSYGSPRIGDSYRSSPKPHSSPKMKLRYLKSIYPKAEEMLLLDILASADNNVQVAGEKLTSMGYEKRDATTPKPPIRNREEQLERERREAEMPPPAPIIRYKSTEEKQQIKARLQDQYKDVAERIITMALESVDYSEEKAHKILEIVLQDDKNIKEEEKKEFEEKAIAENEAAANEISSHDGTSPRSSAIPNDDTKSTLAQDDENNSDETLKIHSTDNTSPESLSSKTDFVRTSHSTQNQRNRTKAKIDHIKNNIYAKQTESDDVTNEKKKIFSAKALFGLKAKTLGPNPDVFKGPNEDLLLSDYIAWNGANPELCVGKRSLAKGPGSANCSARIGISQGPNRDLCKGPKIGLAKGSIFSQLKIQPLAKCN